MCITGALKNSFGCIPDPIRRQAHRDTAIEQYVVDLSRVRIPDFAIVDGRIGMEGIAGGSHFDHPRFANRIIMGADPVAVDTVCAHVMDQNPRVRYLQWADYFGLGNCNLDYIDVRGMSIEEAKVHFMTPAEEHEERTGGKLRLIDLGSCSQCRAVAQGTLHRFTEANIANPVDILYGPGDWEIPADRNERCILIGDCIQERYRNLGLWIPGCPMDRQLYLDALEKLEITCAKCANLVREFVKNHGEEELSFLRILASGKTIFQGSKNAAGSLDSVLVVGDCEKHYARNQLNRAKNELEAQGLSEKHTPEDVVYFIPGHDVTYEALEEGFRHLKEKNIK